MDNPGIKVTFLQVSNPKEKIHKLLSITLDYYESKKKLLLKTDSEATTAYLDKLLWEFPKESFLPHHLSLHEQGYIYLCCTEEIPPSCYSIFNFTKEPLLKRADLTRIYEFEDISSQERKIIFERKYGVYSKAGYHLISL